MSVPVVVPFNPNDHVPLGIAWERGWQFPGGAVWHAEPGPLIGLAEVQILDDPEKDQVTVRLVVESQGRIKFVEFQCQRSPA